MVDFEEDYVEGSKEERKKKQCNPFEGVRFG